MNVYCLTSLLSFIQNAIAYIDVKGELTFDFYPTSWTPSKSAGDDNVPENVILHHKAHTSKETTAAEGGATKTTARDGCVYRYPDRKQAEALLSDMMNQLTKIFVRAYEYMVRQEGRRNGKRFKVVSQKFDSRFFEQAYNLMHKEYRQSINETANVSRLSSHDPCHHQTELKETWRTLLERSKAILKRAAVRCVSDFLRVRSRADDTRAKRQVAQLLLRELAEVRSNQLKVLCDNFKLCYKDLLY